MKSMNVMVICCLLVLSGCADKVAYDAYLKSKEKGDSKYYEAASKPLLDVTLPAPEGKEYKIVVNREVKPIETKQIKDSEWTGAVVAGIVGTTLGVTKGFDWKIKQSDNDAAVKINESDNDAITEQVQAYTKEFKNESIIETVFESSGSEDNQ